MNDIYHPKDGCELKSVVLGRAASRKKSAPSGLFCVGLPDTQGGMCWLAGYDADPTRYYTPSCALTFATWQEAADAIERAKKTHPFKERTYRIMPVAEMETQNISTP